MVFSLRSFKSIHRRGRAAGDAGREFLHGLSRIQNLAQRVAPPAFNSCDDLNRVPSSSRRLL